ncbi:uncharacterized protein LOC111386316 [Olea europaea var. sylvestris]|uniref:uncharacterized protein LOC111386316 n=1 Tax=Olea europaea var. sylvestris TaxID=158386 RepID=UPI000C1CEA9A|nr:uncharacterized protein LOC111386316 [Olea europaea var. sylvestris]
MDPITSHTTEVVEPQKKGTTKQRVDALDETTTRLCCALEGLEEKVEMAESEIHGLHIQLDESQRACAAMTEAATIIPDLQDEMEALRAQLRVLQRAMGNGQALVPKYAPRLRISEPCTYGGAHDAKEVENFLFDMEQYFLTVSIEDEVRKEAIRSQFFPKNVEYQPRRALRDLKHTSSIKEYVKSFSGHMLNIRDMSEKDKLFTFMEGLKPWTRTELQRQKVTDLCTAMGAAECLSDYQTESRKNRPSGSNQAIGGGNRPYRPSSNPNGRECYSQNREGAYQSTRGFQGNYHNSRQENFNGSNINNWNKGKATKDRTDTTPKLKCFLCEGPHRVSECPQKRMVNAHCQLASGGSSSKQEAPQANCHSETDSKEDEDVVGAFSHRCNTLSHRVAEKDDVPLKEAKMEEAKAQICRAKCLMYIDDSEKVKAINSAAQPIARVAKLVLIKVGPFEGRTNLSAVQMDDFKFILGLKFLRDTKTAMLPYFDSLMMMGNKPCGIPTQVGRMGEKRILVMQFSKGFKRNEPYFLCTLRLEEIEEANGPIPNLVKRLIQEFEDIMSDELLKKLPPRRMIDHEIELIPGVKPPARAPYHMSQPEHEELRKQLGEMLESGIIVPAKSPYGAPVLFQKRPMVLLECAATIKPKTRLL